MNRRSRVALILLVVAVGLSMPIKSMAVRAPQQTAQDNFDYTGHMAGDSVSTFSSDQRTSNVQGLKKISIRDIPHIGATASSGLEVATIVQQMLRGTNLATGRALQAGSADRQDTRNFSARLRTENADRSGKRHVRIEQTYQDVPVVGAEVIVHIDTHERIYRITGTYLPSLDISVEPTVSTNDALAVGMKALHNKSGTTVCKQPALVIFNEGLAYRFVICQQGPELGQWVFYIDAHNGSILWHYNDIKFDSPGTDGTLVDLQGIRLEGEDGTNVVFKGWHDDDSGNYFLYNKANFWGIYDNSVSDWEQQAGADWTDNDPTAISAAYNMALTQEYTKNVLGRDSYDQKGTFVKAVVHPNWQNPNNAYWGFGEIRLGDGDGARANSFAVLDVVAHEFGHAITQSTSDLIYSKESGALDEGYSDIFGTLVEFYYQPDGTDSYPSSEPGRNDWLLGEDCWLAHEALRNLRNPNAYGLPSYYKGSHWHDLANPKDHYGVHTNSSVLNHAFYLLSVGGSGENDGHDYDLTGLGIEAAGQIAMHANLNYHTKTDGYAEAREAWLNSADDLELSKQAVQEAFDAVGVHGPPVYRVTFTAQKGGRIVGEANQEVTEGEDCAPVTAEVSDGFAFDGWSGDIATDDNPLTLTNITGDMEVTANFIALPTLHTVKFTAGHGGSIQGQKSQKIEDGKDCTTVTAQPEDGYIFTNWSGDHTGNENPLTLTNITASMEVTANFAAETTVYTVQFDAGNGGSIEGQLSQKIQDGDNCSAVTARPDDGFEFAGWSGDYTGNDNPLTMTNVTRDMTVSATFTNKDKKSGGGGGGGGGGGCFVSEATGTQP